MLQKGHRVGGHGLDFCGLKYTPDRGFCKHGNVISWVT